MTVYKFLNQKKYYFFDLKKENYNLFNYKWMILLKN